MSYPDFWRRIEVHEPWWDPELDVWTALERLGYEVVPVGRSAEAPDAHIATADCLEGLSTEETLPIILIGAPGSQGEDDPRVIGVAGPIPELLDLYTLLQAALEEHPREVPRIPTALAARSLRDGIDTPGVILSLSEKGCLLRSKRRLLGYGSIQLQFGLPDLGLIDTRAEARHEERNEVGLAFKELPEPSRAAIAEFVTTSLTQGF